MIQSFTAFEGPRRLISGNLAEVALAVKRAGRPAAPIIIFSDATGRSLDLDLRGSDEEIVARLPRTAPTPAPDAQAPEPRGRGRPKLGVVAREVTLLPRHWEWLNAQPGGASVALRKLVDEARRTSGDRDRCASRVMRPITSCLSWPATSPISRKLRARCLPTTSGVLPA
jgi:hypothetical protein